MEIKALYITKEDFKDYFGIDLDAELPTLSDGGTNKANQFICGIEDEVATFINSHFFKNVNALFPKFTDEQKDHYRKALLEQAYYKFKNGDIGADSGYDAEKGKIASQTYLEEITIGQKAKNHLILCNLWNCNIGRR